MPLTFVKKPASAKPAFLKKASDKYPVRSPKYLLHRHLSGHHPGRSRAKVHASEVTREGGLCPRLYGLFDAGAYKTANEWLTTSEAATFEIGRIWQDAVVNHFADMGKAVGHWKCLSCDHIHEYMLRPAKCTCGCKAFKPEEVRFESAITGVSCGVDMLLKTGADKLTAIEIKTMNPEDFKALVGPLGEHRLRTNFYCRLIGESAHPFAQQVDTTSAVVFYTTKGGWGCVDPIMKAEWDMSDRHSPFKEFTVKRDDALTQSLMKAALVVKARRAGEIGMPKGVCLTSFTERAKRCEARQPCFSGEYPGTHDWNAKAS